VVRLLKTQTNQPLMNEFYLTAYIFTITKQKIKQSTNIIFASCPSRTTSPPHKEASFLLCTNVDISDIHTVA
jgi:hypothetical protein